MIDIRVFFFFLYSFLNIQWEIWHYELVGNTSDLPLLTYPLWIISAGSKRSEQRNVVLTNATLPLTTCLCYGTSFLIMAMCSASTEFLCQINPKFQLQGFLMCRWIVVAMLASKPGSSQCSLLLCLFSCI